MFKIYNKTVLMISLLLALLAACVPQSTAQPTLTTAQPVALTAQLAPDFTLPNALGGEVSLADYRGQQPVLLFFHMAVG